MDPAVVDIAIVAVGAPAVGFVYQQLFLHASYQAKQLRNMEESATETQLTEATVPPLANK
jgi:hypothetical protein